MVECALSLWTDWEPTGVTEAQVWRMCERILNVAERAKKTRVIEIWKSNLKTPKGDIFNIISLLAVVDAWTPEQTSSLHILSSLLCSKHCTL